MWAWGVKEPKAPSSCPTVAVCWVAWLAGARGMSRGSCRNVDQLSPARSNAVLAGSVQTAALGFAIPTPNGSPPFLSEEEMISELKPAINVPLLSRRDCEITLQTRRSPSLRCEQVCSLLPARHCFVGFRPRVPLALGSHLEPTEASNGQSDPGIKCVR